MTEIKSRIVKTEEVEWRKLEWFQSNLKEMSKADFDKLKKSLVTNGFVMPFHVWQNGKTWILDGHHRQKAMQELEKAGHDIPERLPANFIRCKDRKEAAKLVLVYSSIYARTTDEGLYEFINQNDLNFDDLKLEIDLPEFDAERFAISHGGLPVDETDKPQLRDGDRAPFRQAAFILHDEQFEDVQSALRKAMSMGGASRQRTKTETAMRLPLSAGSFSVGDAKRIIVKPIAAADANRIVRALHYSHKVVQNSQVHLGVFLDGRCGGALQFGPSMDKRKMVSLVRGTLWNEFIELNRMAMADWLPRNGESRVLGVALRWLKREYPFLKWVVSFADATQCGDGTIYRASGFVLTGINDRPALLRMPSGEVRHRLAMHTDSSVANAMGGAMASVKRMADHFGAEVLRGHMLRYVYFLDSAARERLTVPVIPFSEIERCGAQMYKGKRASSRENAAPAVQAGEGGAIPTDALHFGSN